MTPTHGRDEQAFVGESARAAALAERLEAAVASVRALACLEVDDLDGAPLQSLLAQLPRLIRQLEGVRARAGAAAQRAEIRRRPAEQIGRILTDHQQQLAQQQRLSPTETKRVLDAGRAATDHPRTGAALRAGELDNAHAQTIARILTDVPRDRRDAVEAELLALARQLDPVAFGRRARQVLGREQAPALARDERRQHFRRRFRATDTDDGGLAISGAFYGVAAEQIRVALRAFRRPDTPDEHRTPDQRGADAVEQLCAAALRAGQAPTEHGVRPQVIVTLSAAEFAALEDDPTGVTGTLLHSGQTVTGRELRSLVADARLLRLVLAADRTPIEVSTTVRTVPVGLWRALLVRDGGCVWPGCDAPAAWCDVAHGREAYADDGALSPGNAMLLCRRHHRTFDAGARRVEIHGDTVTFPGIAPIGAERAADRSTSRPPSVQPARTRVVTVPTPARCLLDRSPMPAGTVATGAAHDPTGQAPPGRGPAPPRQPGRARGTGPAAHDRTGWRRRPSTALPARGEVIGRPGSCRGPPRAGLPSDSRCDVELPCGQPGASVREVLGEPEKVDVARPQPGATTRPVRWLSRWRAG